KDASSVQQARRIDGFGRFNHEAAWIDPETSICYLSEDHGDGCFYRFLPDDPRDPYTGRLQAMKILGRPQFDTSTGVRVGDRWSIEWVNIARPADDPKAQGRQAGAAKVARGEGLWVGGGEVWFDATEGGPAKKGQIFRLKPNGDGGQLELMAQS